MTADGPSVEILRASEHHLSALLPLFSAYREFYRQAPDPAAEQAFLEARMACSECVVLLAREMEVPNRAVGFVLLYPCHDSVGMQSAWVLHDLFVAPSHRQHGLGRRLMAAAHAHCRAAGVGRVDLATATDNRAAQALYESLGYERDGDFYYYSLDLAGTTD